MLSIDLSRWGGTVAKMNKNLSLAAVAIVVVLAVFLPLRNALGQTANGQFTGSSWRLVSGTLERGGKRMRLAAPRLQGFLMFDATDHFLIVITRLGSPRLESSIPQGRTQRSRQASLQRSIACFGTYAISEADHTISAHIEGSTFPKWTGTDQQRQFTISDDKLTWTDTSQSGGAKTVELVWKRVTSAR
jgi:lipocalin-like protein